jgi:glycosyltransferase involved in cell wall biosynthesis
MINLNVVFLGTGAGFGYSFAATNTKTEFMARGLVEQGGRVTIINSIVGCSCVNRRTVLHYANLCDVISYPKKGSQIISWLKNLSDLKNDLKSLYESSKKNVVILESPDYHIYKVYCFFARKFGYKIAVISHEWLPTVKSIHFFRKPSAYLYTKNFGYLADGILPISEYIIKKIKKFNKPYLKIPVIAEFNGIQEGNTSSNYFVYCVYAAYSRVILPLIDAFISYQNMERNNQKLVLVLAGSDSQVQVIVQHIEQMKGGDVVKVKRNIPYCELISLYKNALGLIIPLDPSSEQDHARFSQKIAEYSSTSTPIITCGVGETEFYFRDKESAFFCNYNPEGFIDAFRWISLHPNLAKNIGKNGYKVGEMFFNYKIVGLQLADFLCSL